MPKDVPGCVLSLIAKQANAGQIPLASTSVWADRSKVRTSYSYSNMIANGNFPDTTGWSGGVTTTISASNNTLSATATGAAEYAAPTYTTNIPVAIGKKLYVRAKVRVTGASCLAISLNMFGTTSGSVATGATISNPVQNQWYTISAVWTVATIAGNYKPYVVESYLNSTISNGKVMEVQEIMMVTLDDIGLQTLATAQCDALFAFTATTATVSRANDCLMLNQAGSGASGFNSEVNSNSGRTVYFNRLDGSDDFGSFANTPSLDILTGDIAVSATFRVATGGPNGYLFTRNLDLATAQQYGFYYDTTGYIALYLNGISRVHTGLASIATNTWYNVIFYRNYATGVITPYLNKLAKTPATYVDALITQPNTRLGARSSNAGGTTQTIIYKGDIGSESIYNAPTLDISKIIKAEMNASFEYTGIK